MKYIVNNYGNHDLSWIESDDIIVYDKKKINKGYNIYDYMDWIIKNYYDLPDVVAFVKGNMLDRHIAKEEWDKIKDNKTFTPILTQLHKTYDPVCHYENGLYYERNDSWYFYEHEHRFFDNYGDLAKELGLPNPDYLGFAPGGCYIVPKENILKHSRKFYAKIKKMVGYTQLPAEAHAIERSLYNIWS